MSNSLGPHGLYVARQAPLPVEFSRQEYQSWQPFPSPDLPDPEIDPGLLHCRQILYHLSHQGTKLEAKSKLTS